MTWVLFYIYISGFGGGVTKTEIARFETQKQCVEASKDKIVFRNTMNYYICSKEQK